MAVLETEITKEVKLGQINAIMNQPIKIVLTDLTLLLFLTLAEDWRLCELFHQTGLF